MGLATSENKHIVVVLGMHRSGTSVITRGLQVLGVDLGERLMAPQQDNERGFWEDLEVNALNIEVLSALGHDWHTLTPVLDRELTGPAVEEFKTRALEILQVRLSKIDYFGLKDPRIPRLLSFWQDVFARLQAKVSYLITCRNPLNVAASLALRNGFDPEKSYFLWLEHMLESIAQTYGRPRLAVDYDRLLDDPATQLGRIAEILDLRFDSQSLEFCEFLKFLEGSLRHHRQTLQDLQRDDRVPPGVSELYELLLKLSADEVAFDDDEVAGVLHRIDLQYRQNYLALRYMRHWEEKATTLAERVNAVTELIAERDRQVSQMGQALAAADAAATACQAEMMAVKSQAAELRSQLDMVFSSRSWKIAQMLKKVAFPFKRFLQQARH
ncbi:MAG TPA: hypothetical protein VFU27_11735 [Terriglobales bacterium]|nr:hypothetical protein [Terriglobales bacterium]